MSIVFVIFVIQKSKNIDKQRFAVYNVGIMNTITNQTNPADYRLPRYREIPNVGLYLEQCAKYVNMHLTPLGFPELTTSMISNYVKQKIISGPQKKQYGAEHIACLVVLAIMKSVLSIEDARLILDDKRSQYDIASGYDVFCDIFEAQLKETFRPTAAKAPAMRKKEGSAFPSTGIVHNVVFAAVHKIYLNRQIKELRDRMQNDEAAAKQGAKKKDKEASAKEEQTHESSVDTDPVG